MLLLLVFMCLEGGGVHHHCVGLELVCDGKKLVEIGTHFSINLLDDGSGEGFTKLAAVARLKCMSIPPFTPLFSAEKSHVPPIYHPIRNMGQKNQHNLVY